MRFYADLHVHSRHSRACSRDGDLEHLAWWAARKGITVLGTGDFTHPEWAAELQETLVPAGDGLFRLRDDVEQAVQRTLPPACRRPVRFLLSTEISTIYKRDGRTRKVHHLLYAPTLAAAAEITRRLDRVGNLAADGRPILGLDSRDLLETTLESGDGTFLVPAHVWTPWFAVLGSKSGFDAVEDCYADLADHVFALETGLSSDPEMNRRVSSLDRYQLVSNSDAHSPPALGREATVFDTDVGYQAIRRAMATGDGLAGTVEFFPEEGKYHLDGHRACDVRLAPGETRAHGGQCPTCGRPLTVGVLHRVEALADRADGTGRPGVAGARSLVPLPEVVGELRGVGPRSKSVVGEVSRLVGRLGPELAVLDEVPLDDVAAAGGPLLAEAIGRLRRGDVVRESGYDGEYGVIRLFDPKELADLTAEAVGGEPLFDIAEDLPGARDSPATPAPAAGTTAGPAPTPTAAEPVPTPAAAEPTTAPAAAEPTTAAAEPATALAAGEAAAPELVLPLDRFTRRPGRSLLDGLDPDQRAAAVLAGGPLLVVAGPGTGKTRTLTHLLAHRARTLGIPPEQQLALTFTRRAAAEMAERLHDLVPEHATRLPVTTFHGLGLRIVREQHERLGLPAELGVADDAQRGDLLTQACREAAPPAAGAGGGARLDAAVTAARRERALGTPVPTALAAVVDAYDAALARAGLVDLDDLLALPVRLLGEPEVAAEYRRRFPWVCVDEYQDVDALQYRLLRLLCPPDGNLVAIGDPDQAIYGFRGADVGFFLRFAEDYPTARTVRLTRTYRSTPTIVRASLAAVAPATLVPDRDLVAVGRDADDAPVVVHRVATEQDEASLVAESLERMLGGASFHALDSGAADGHVDARLSFSDVAVLYRTAAQAQPLVDALGRKGFPVQRRSHERLTDQPGVRVVVDTLRVESPLGRGGSTGGREAVLDRVRRVARGVLAGAPGGEPDGRAPGGTGSAGCGDAETVVDLLAPLARDCGADLERFLTELTMGAQVDAWDPRADRVSLLTLHAAKGLEFPVVFVVGCEDGLLPLRWGARGGSTPGAGDATAEAEERRLFYVGMTRARSRLVLTYADARARTAARGPSPFLADLPSGLVERRSPAASRGSRRRGDTQLRLL